VRRAFQCTACDAPAARSERWDAAYCTSCKRWLEPPCKCLPEDKCPFAGDRPETAEDPQ
jgi:hypothetical protein